MTGQMTPAQAMDREVEKRRDLAAKDARIAVLEGALRPFAEFADLRGYVPDDHAITQGSGLAKRQLTMGDCREAAAALSPTGGGDG